jgi:hypothetical protein
MNKTEKIQIDASESEEIWREVEAQDEAKALEEANAAAEAKASEGLKKKKVQVSSSVVKYILWFGSETEL